MARVKRHTTTNHPSPYTDKGVYDLYFLILAWIFAYVLEKKRADVGEATTRKGVNDLYL